MEKNIKRLTPTKETLIRLFAKSGNQCAFPDCTHEVFSEDTLVAQVCHIKAAQQGGERFDTSMDNEQRRGLENLIILCHKHHKITDNVKLYSASSLIEMKRKHEERQNKELKLKESQLVLMIQDIDNDSNSILTYNREIFMFILVAIIPYSMLSILQIKFNFFLGSWMVLILIISLLVALRVRKSLSIKFQKVEEAWFSIADKIESTLHIDLPKSSKQGFLYSFLILTLGISVFIFVF